jgi:hypothetical protein
MSKASEASVEMAGLVLLLYFQGMINEECIIGGLYADDPF